MMPDDAAENHNPRTPWPVPYPEGCRCRKVPDYNPRLGIYQCPDCKRPVRPMDSWLDGWEAEQAAKRKR